MLCKLYIIWPHESLGSKNSHSQRTPRIGGAQLTSARTPTTGRLPCQGAPAGRATPTPPPSVGSCCLGPLYLGTDLIQLVKASGLEALPGAECLEEPGGRQLRLCWWPRDPFPSPVTCLEWLREAHWEASRTVLQMRTLGPIQGEHGKADLATVRWWTGGLLADVLAFWKSGAYPGPCSVCGEPTLAGRQDGCGSPGCYG